LLDRFLSGHTVTDMDLDREEGTRPELDFSKLEKVVAAGYPVIPAVAQSVLDGRVLMVGYVNEAALKTALDRKTAVFWSTSRGELWIKGAGSGDTLSLVEVRVNCEQNSILYLVKPEGEGVCHTKDSSGKTRPSCYYRVLENGALRHAPYRPVWRSESKRQG